MTKRKDPKDLLPRGRPKHIVTDETKAIVRKYCQVEIPKKALAMKLGISETSLRTHYKDIMDEASNDLHVDVASVVVELTKHEDPKIAGDNARWWLANKESKTYGTRKDVKTEITDKTKRPPVILVPVSSRIMPDKDEKKSIPKMGTKVSVKDDDGNTLDAEIMTD